MSMAAPKKWRRARATLVVTRGGEGWASLLYVTGVPERMVGQGTGLLGMNRLNLTVGTECPHVIGPRANHRNSGSRLVSSE